MSQFHLQCYVIEFRQIPHYLLTGALFFINLHTASLSTLFLDDLIALIAVIIDACWVSMEAM